MAVPGVAGGLVKPARHIVERLPVFGFACKNRLQIGLLLFGLPSAAQIRRVAANIGFIALIFKIDFGLAFGRAKQVIATYTVRSYPPAGTRFASKCARNCRRLSSFVHPAAKIRQAQVWRRGSANVGGHEE